MSYLFLVGYFVNALFASTNWRLSPHMVLIECILSVLYSKYGLRCAATEVQGKRWDLLSDGSGLHESLGTMDKQTKGAAPDLWIMALMASQLREPPAIDHTRMLA